MTISKYDEKTCILPVEEQLTYTPEKCFEFDNATGTIIKYNKSDSDCGVDVVIPETIGGITVKAIGSYAFVENWQSEKVGDIQIINSVVFPSGLESIGEKAFLGSNGPSSIFNQITELDFSKSTKLTTVGEKAFMENQLTSVNLNPLTNLKIIGDASFRGNQLISLDFSKLINLITIGAFAFYGNELMNITFGSINKLGIIGNSAFCGNDGGVTYDAIPSSVIENDGFYCK